MNLTKWQSRTKQGLIIEVWEALDCESVGARELKQIQAVLRAKFGEGAVQSPASIARTVADEGAVLRHPEVFDCDLKWRRQQMTQILDGLDFSDLSRAFESVVRLEEKRLELQTELQRPTGEKEKGDGETEKAAESRELRDIVTAAREESLLRARSQILEKDQREQAREISEWLRVWLQAPELFSDWLDLRRRSPEFRRKFAGNIANN